jgi:hypothetical protein
MQLSSQQLTAYIEHGFGEAMMKKRRELSYQNQVVFKSMSTKYANPKSENEFQN